MEETAVAPREVQYVDPEVRGSLPRGLVTAWPAEESCRRVEEALADLDPAAKELLLARATSFADEVLAIVKREVLPFEIEPCLFLDPANRLHLIGTRAGNKVRIDEDLNVALVRETPLELAGTRAGAMRAELRDLFCFSLGSADRRPAATLRALDLSPAGGPGAFHLELDAPEGSGYVMGRFDRLRAYGDGKILLVGFRPIGAEEEAAGSAGAAGAGEEEAGRAFSREGGAGEGVFSSPAGGEPAAAPATSGGSGSPLDQPGWAATVAPVLPE